MNLDFWFISSILATLSIGIIAFINKVFAERKYDPRFSAMILSIVMFFISIPYLLFKGVYYNITSVDILLSLIWGLQMYSYALIMMNALKYLPTSTYFIGVRLGSSFVLLAFGIIFFKDIISNLEFFGYILGIFAIILLFEKEKKEKTNFKKGVPILLFGILSLVVGHSITKYFSLNNEITPSILTLAFLFSIIFSFIFGYKNIKKNLIHLKPIFLINLVQGFLYVFYFIMLFYVYKIGDLGISYKIQSYSPFIPIILSAIIYKEKITKKRALAIVLTILSLWFFV